ncbi:uncharacterized protein [Musca autumnalis]|uniref:uncharacterized protein n=1 Tax=Musca autumnalis TaxID=221902 RepID=UPI003CF22C36
MAAVTLRISLILLIFCTQTIWAMHVVIPEYTSRNEFVDTLVMKEQQQQYHKSSSMVDENEENPLLRQQSSVKYQTNFNGTATTTAINTHTQANTHNTHSQIQNALNAKTKTSQRRRHHTSYDKNDDVVTTSGGVGPTSMHNNEENENTFENSLYQEQHSRQRRELSDWLIAPNTRWCGRGNLANGTYNTLGGATNADKCCRKHDHCKVFIGAMSQRYGLFNYRPYTLSHCSCDRRFRTCLKMANDEDAKTIGQLFFNMVQTQCFVLAKEQVCLERAKNGTCVREEIKQKAHLRNNKKF